MNVLAYARVSTSKQEDDGFGLDAQAHQMREACERRGWTIAELVTEQGSGKDLHRPGLRGALERIARREADGLIVAKMDRLSRSLPDFAMLLDWFRDANATFVALDFDIDTSTPTGELMAGMVVMMAQWERRMISVRTRDALAEMRRQGLRTGPGSVADDPVLAGRIRGLRGEGLSLQAIADVLNAEGVPTLRGAERWRRQSLVSVLGGSRRVRRGLVTLPEIAR